MNILLYVFKFIMIYGSDSSVSQLIHSVDLRGGTQEVVHIKPRSVDGSEETEQFLVYISLICTIASSIL